MRIGDYGVKNSILFITYIWLFKDVMEARKYVEVRDIKRKL